MAWVRLVVLVTRSRGLVFELLELALQRLPAVGFLRTQRRSIAATLACIPRGESTRTISGRPWSLVRNRHRAGGTSQ